jgi:hypothetical protein
VTDSIFLLGEDGSLRALEKRGYVTEDRLQELLASHPQLLAGEQMDLNAPRRWLLVSREVGIPSSEETGNRWSVDHLFLDQDAIPTLVEVKRSTDTRLRREVVGQLLEYASNAVAYWSPDFIRERFESACRDDGREPADELTAFLEEDDAYEEYWDRVKTNLQAGRIRLLFVADHIPTELRQIVEFLNRQMNPAEVLAVEITQYRDDHVSTLVPRVLGHTAVSQATKGSRAKKKWDRESFIAALQNDAPVAVPIVERILQWATEVGLDVWWGEGTTTGSFVPLIRVDGQKHQLFAVSTTGTIEMYFYWWAYKPPFSDDALRSEMLQRVNEIDGVEIGPDQLNKRPSFSLTLVGTADGWERLTAAFQWYLDTLVVGG